MADQQFSILIVNNDYVLTEDGKYANAEQCAAALEVIKDYVDNTPDTTTKFLNNQMEESGEVGVLLNLTNLKRRVKP